MIKIFVQRDHHELEAQVNDWICSNSVTILDISHSVCISEEEILHSIMIRYKSDDSKLC